jgi:MoaA/NifB/PqqE/SkfB family radical SAM enzyme
MIYGTDLCDSGCKHCLIWAKRPINYLPFEKIVDIMQSRCITKRTTIGLEGGEFLLHPDAMKILEWFSKHHSNFDLLTNGLKPEKVIEAVTKFPPQRLFISLDGPQDTYHNMRGKDGYDGIINLIEKLHSIVPISAMFTLSPYNDFDDLEHVAQVCKKYGIDLRIGVYNNISFF